MGYRFDDQQQRLQLLTIVDRGTAEQLFSFLQGFHRRPFQDLNALIEYTGAIDDEIDFIDCTGTKYNVTPLIIASGKGSYEKVKILLVHGANPNQQCATGDTALNLAVHRQKYRIVDLLLQYHANPNIYNQAGKTALHRAVLSYTDENINRIRALLDAKGDLYIEDRNQRTPFDEAVLANRPEVVDVLLSHDRTLVEHCYRAAIIASRLGYDKCLEVLLNYGMNPNIADRTNTTPLHVAVRALQLSTVRLLIAHGADPNVANNRGETPAAAAEYLQPDQRQNFINAIAHTPPTTLSNFYSYKGDVLGNAISYVYPLLRSHSNWTLDSDEFRSSTAENSSVQNLLDTSNGTYWRSTQSKNAWIIFDLKHQYNIAGVRIIGCENQSTSKNGHVDVSNALNGPWLKVKDFTCLINQGNKNDFLFPSLKTRYIRVFILDNYGGEGIQIQGIGFFGLDTQLVTLLKEYNLENSLNTLLANGINDLDTLYENQDEILNSSDKYLHVNDHFQFIRLTESLRSPQLTFLEWFNPPQTTVIAGDKLHTFSVAADEGVTDRVKLEEQLENSPQANTILMRDLEPIQGRSLVDFPDYTIKHPGRYKIRVASVEYPDIHTPWQEIVVGSTSPYSHTLNIEGDNYLSSTTPFVNDTTSDKENTSLAQKKSTTSLSKKDNRAFVAEVYESDLDDTIDDTFLISLKSIEESPYNFSATNMSYTTDSTLVDNRHEKPDKLEHYTQTKAVDYYDHSTNTDEDYDEGYNSSSRLNSKPSSEKYLTPTKYRLVSRTPLSNIFPYNNTNLQKQSDDDEILNYGEKIIIPTKYRLLHDRLNKLRNGGYVSRSQQQQQEQQVSIEQQSQFQQRQSQNRESPRQEFRKQNQPFEEPVQQKQQQQSDDDELLHYGEKIIIPTKYRLQHDRLDTSLTDDNTSRSQKQTQKQTEQPGQFQRRQSQNRESPQQHQSQYYRRQQPRKRTQSVEEPTRKKQQQQSHYRSRHQSQQQHESPRESSPEEQQQQQSQYRSSHQSQKRDRSPRESSPEQEEQSHYYELNQSQSRIEPKGESLSRQPQSQHQQQSSSRKRTDSDDEPSEQQSEYYGQGPSQNKTTRAQNPSPPPKQRSQHEPTERLRQQSGSARESSPPQRQQQRQSSDYYELQLSPKQDEPVRESPNRPQQQQASSRKRTDSDDEPSEQQSEYYGQGPSQNKTTRAQNLQPSPPPPKQQLQYEPTEQLRQQNGSARESSPPQRQSSDYYELELSPKQNQPVRDSPVQQQQSHKRNGSELRTPPSSKVKQQIHQRKESDYDSTHLPPSHDQPLQSRIDSDEESPSQRHQSQQHQISLENVDQGTWKPLYNRYRIITGDFELTESPSDNSTNPNESKSGQMQLVFKAILQGQKVQERAEKSIHDFGIDGSRTQTISSAINPTNFNRASHPGSRQSPINEDRQNQNSTNTAYQTRSNYQPRINSTVHSTPERSNRDHDKHTDYEHDPSRQSSSAPNASRKRQSHHDQLPLDNHPAPSNRNIHTENDDDLDGIHERSRSSSSQNRKSPKYEKNPLKRADHSRSSPLLTSPKGSPKASPTSSEHKAKYFFGENVQNPASDEDSDGADCEMFGHNSQPKPLTNTAARRNLDYPSATASRFPLHANNSSENPQFGQQTDVGITTENSLPQQQYSSLSPHQSTVRNTGDSLQQSQPLSHANSYPVTTNTSLNKNFSNETSSTTGFQRQHSTNSDHYEQNIGSHIRQEQPSNRFNQNTYDNRESPDEDDDPDRDNDRAVEYEEHDDDIHDRMHDNSADRHYMNEVVDDDDDNLPRSDDSPHTSVPPSSGVGELIQQNPVGVVPMSYQPIQYPASPPSALSRPGIDNTGKSPKKAGLFGFFGGNKSKDVDKNKSKSTQKKPTKTRDTSGSRATSKR